MTKEIEWDPNDPVLTADKAPHEVSGVMRWHQAKVPSQEILRMLRLRGTQLIAALEKAKADEIVAQAKGIDIHSPLMPKEADS